GRLGLREGADRVDHDAFRSHRPGRRPQQLALELDEAGHLFGPDAPPQLGPPAQDSQAGARRIDEDTIAAAVAEREVPAVGDDREHVIEPEAVPGGGDPPNPSRGYVAGDDAPLRNPLAPSP